MLIEKFIKTEYVFTPSTSQREESKYKKIYFVLNSNRLLAYELEKQTYEIKHNKYCAEINN